jgi:very-short-patch-repair endonuclease
MQIHNKKSLKQIRRNLRQEQTVAEYILWQNLRGSKLGGLKFKRQHSIGNYIVDFYCATKRLIIEVDGAVHLEKEQKQKDEERDANLLEMGFKILRFSNTQIIAELEHAKEQILNY